MSGARRAGATDERAVYLPATGEHVFGVLTSPSGPANGVAVLLLHAGVQNMSSHRNGMWTTLCRELAGHGFMTFRMDFHGTGDSSGRLADRNVSGQTGSDVDAAVTWLGAQGAQRLVIAGTCWGALVALAASARHPAISTALLVTPPLHLLESDTSPDRGRAQHAPVGEVVRVVLRPRVARLLLTDPRYRQWVRERARRRWALWRGRHAASGRPAASPGAHVVDGLRRNRTDVRVLFGEQDRGYQSLLRSGGMPGLRADDLFDVVVTPVPLHGMATLASQEAAHRQIVEWLTGSPDRGNPDASEGLLQPTEAD